MGGLDQIQLNDYFEGEKNQKELFSNKDLKKFTEIVADKDDFAILLKGLTKTNILTEINNKEVGGKKDGLKTTIDTEIGKNKDKLSIFDDYVKLSNDADKNLYEICVLGAMLKNETERKSNPDYKTLAKEYYLSINPLDTKDKKIQYLNLIDNKNDIYTRTGYDGKYAFGADGILYYNGNDYGACSFDAKTGGRKGSLDKPVTFPADITTKIGKAITIEKRETKPDIQGHYESAKADMENQTVTDIKQKTSIENGKKITEASVNISAGADMRLMNIEGAKVIYNQKKDTLKTLANSFTGNNKIQINDIFKELYGDDMDKNTVSTHTFELNKKIEADKSQEGNYYLIGARVAEGFIKALNELSKNPEPALTLSIDWKGCIIGKTPQDIKDDRYINLTLKVTKIDTPKGETQQKDKPIVIVNPDDKKVNPDDKKESLEAGKVKGDIADHFKFQGNDINSSDVSDIIQDIKDKNSYTVTIKGYTDFIVKYTGDNKLEIIKGIIKKGLLKRNINEGQSVDIDRYNRDRSKIKKDLVTTFNAAESKNYINEKLTKITTGDQGKFEVKNDADVTEGTIKFEYANSAVLKPGDDKVAITDKIVFSLDENFMIKKGKDASIPLERQKAKGEKDKISGLGSYRIDDGTDKLTYYAKTSEGFKNPTIEIMNNIVHPTDNGDVVVKSPLFKKYTDLIKQDRTLEAYTNKVMMTYDTPGITSMEKQFQNTASVEYDNEKKYSISTTFDVPGNKALQVTLPIEYIEGSSANQNTSSVKYTNNPILSRTDGYNKIENGNIMIDGIIYSIGVADKQKKHTPTMIFRHLEERTIDKAKGRTSIYKIESNTFGIKKLDDQTQGYKVNAGFGNCEFGPLIVKDGKRSDPITYYKDVFIGQVKDGQGRIILKGTKIGSMSFDQHGKFLEYNTEEGQMTFNTQTKKVDIVQNTPTGIKNPLGKPEKNILLTQKFEGTTLNVNIMDPAEKYTGNKTGEDFIKQQDKDKKTSDFYTPIDTKTMIGEGRISIFNGLQKISSDDIESKDKNLFEYAYEINKNADIVLGPDRKGVYAYEIIKGNKEYMGQYIYCKVDNKKITLCNADGETISNQKIYIKDNKDYYNVKLNDNQTEFRIEGKKKEIQAKTPEVKIDTDSDYNKYIGDLTEDRNCGYRSMTGEEKNSYQFMCGKYKSFEIDVTGKEGEKIENGDKIAGLDGFSLIDQNQEGFGTYQKFFKTPEQENLGISEKTYNEVFGKLLKDNETKTDDLVKVKYKKDGKFYYAPMHLEVDRGRSGKNIFKLTESKGREEAIKKTEKRLENLVKACKISLEQESTANNRKGDMMEGRYLVKPTIESINTHFKDPTKDIEFTIRTNNKVGGKYVEQKIKFNPTKETLDPKNITIDGIKYGLRLKTDNKMIYKIIVNKGEATAQ